MNNSGTVFDIQINDSTYNEIIKLEDNDLIFEKSLELLPIFLDKYKAINDGIVLDESIFRKEVKTIFSLLHHVFTSEELDDSDTDEETIEKFQTLCSHFKNITGNIDTMDLHNISNDTKESFDFINNYFKDNLQAEKEMNKSIENLGNTLEKGLSALEFSIDLNEKIKEIKPLLKKEELSFDEIANLTNEVKKFKKDLKERYEKDLVIKTISNLESEKPTNYFEIAKSFTKKESTHTRDEMEEINQILIIENLISIILNIETKLKKLNSNILNK